MSGRRVRRGSGRQFTEAAEASRTDSSLADVSAMPLPCGDSEQKVSTGAEEVKASPHGISILKEIFPDHGADMGHVTAQKAPTVEQLLGNVATPVRGSLPRGTPLGTIPVGPPAHAPILSIAPAGPPMRPLVPPPPSMPAPVCRAPQQPWEAPRTTEPPAVPGVEFVSYRERLRAGGRGVFQRTIDSGLMPKAMKHEWGPNAMQVSASQQPEAPNSMMLQYSSGYESQQMWMGVESMQGNEYWGSQIDQSQCAYMQQGTHFQQPAEMSHMMMPTSDQSLMLPMPQQSQSQMSFPVMSPMHTQQSQLQQAVHMAPMTFNDQPMQMLEMQSTQPQLPQMQQQGLPPVSMAQVHVSTPMANGDNTPSEIDRCMAMVMPQSSQFAHDKDLLAAQLRAAADCQCYED